jgi:hypothetical protein
MICILSYIVFCIVLAWYNYRRISLDKRIYHGINGALHLLAWAGVYLITRSWWLTASLPFLGKVVFDSSLYLMRGLPLDYVPKNPKSIIDKIEKRVFPDDGLLPKIAYFVISATLIIVHYATH